MARLHGCLTSVLTWMRRRWVRPRSSGGAQSSAAHLDALAHEMWGKGFTAQDV